jgi:hypothetical protein
MAETDYQVCGSFVVCSKPCEEDFHAGGVIIDPIGVPADWQGLVGMTAPSVGHSERCNMILF